MLKKLIVIFIILGSLSFFSLAMLGKISKLFELVAIALIVVLLIIDAIYFKGMRQKRHFTIPIVLMFIALVLSMFSASYIHNQPLGITIYIQRDIYFYLFYFLLHVLNIDQKDLQKIILYIGVVYTLCYIVQYFAYPSVIFDVFLSPERGTVRVYLAGSGYALLSYFLCLQIFYSTNKLSYLLLAMFFLVTVFLFGARSGLFAILSGTLFQLVLSKRIKSRVLIYFLIFASIIPLFLVFQEVFAGIAKATQSNRAEGGSYVRLVAAKYFLTEFANNKIVLLTGNGVAHQSSSFGRTMQLLQQKYGYFLSDIGIIGNFVTYGILFLVGLLWIVTKFMVIKIKPDLNYMKYFNFFMVIIMLPIAGGFASSHVIVLVCCMMYLMDKSNSELRNKPLLE